MLDQKTILIVDDDAAIRRLSRRLLQRHDFQTLEAENGKEGLELFSDGNERIHAVLLDLNLPDGVGTDWATKYREIHPELPIIFFTGSNAPSGWNDQENLQNYYLKKPFTPVSIHDVVQKALA